MFTFFAVVTSFIGFVFGLKDFLIDSYESQNQAQVLKQADEGSARAGGGLVEVLGDEAQLAVGATEPPSEVLLLAVILVPPLIFALSELMMGGGGSERQPCS